MTFRTPLFLLAAAALLAGCQPSSPEVSADPQAKQAPVPPPPAPAAAAAKTEEKSSFGEPLSASSAKVTLADLVKTPGKYADKTIQTEGTVTAVCQSRGCWLELGDDSGTAHVKLGGHKFFVPKSSSGRRAKVEATVLPAVDKGHCEQEAEEQTGKVAKVELMATGVELF